MSRGASYDWVDHENLNSSFHVSIRGDPHYQYFIEADGPYKIDYIVLREATKYGEYGLRDVAKGGFEVSFPPPGNGIQADEDPGTRGLLLQRKPQARLQRFKRAILQIIE